MLLIKFVIRDFERKVNIEGLKRYWKYSRFTYLFFMFFITEFPKHIHRLNRLRRRRCLNIITRRFNKCACRNIVRSKYKNPQLILS